jgi:(E)-4-hydroxy-3-methylbut-2-enyl-diphosphate synthase
MKKIVNIGNLKVGSGYPIRIKGMIKSPSSEIERMIVEAKRLEEEGAEAIRVAVQNSKDTEIRDRLKKAVIVPLVADIHFHYKLALKAIEKGFEGIRLNPSNIYRLKEIREVVREAKKAKISIRVGVNSGGFKERFPSEKMLAEKMVKRVEDYIKIFEKENFFDIIISLKASTVNATVLANELFSKKFNYPLHLGVTASGPFLNAIVKSSIGIGTLLYEGIGNIIRVSLTAPSFWEIRVAKFILEAVNLRRFGPEIISCPTCSRCEVNLIEAVSRFKDKLEKEKFREPLRIAIMGCVVNGPGEAHQADIGVAFGKKRGVIFRKNKIVGMCSGSDIIGDLFRKVRTIWK